MSGSAREAAPTTAEPALEGSRARPRALGRNGRGIASAAYRTARVILRRDSTVRRSLGVADAVSLLLAAWVGASVLGDARLTPAVLAAVPILVLAAKVMGLYDRDANLLHKNTLDEVPALFWLSALSALALWLAGDLIIDGELGRSQVVAIWGTLFVSMTLTRSVARLLAARVAPVERCVFVGDPESAEEFAEKLATSPSVKAELVGSVPGTLHGSTGAGTEASTDGEGPDMLEKLAAMIAEREVHRVILGPGVGASEEILRSIRQLKDFGVKVSVMPRTARVALSSVELDHLNGITLLGVRRFEITHSSRIVKRAFDVAGSALALALFAPLMVAIAVAIRLDSRGPVMFRQPRAGRRGEPFEMLKFRSMVDGADEQKDTLRHLNEADGVFKIADDPRITRAGTLIRRLSLDELPQLINVLRGDMSLVGPRPLPLDEDRLIEGWYRGRHDLRPGMTGPWQILGSRVPLREMVKLDYQYVADWSLWNDIRILLLTIPHVLGRRGV